MNLGLAQARGLLRRIPTPARFIAEKPRQNDRKPLKYLGLRCPLWVPALGTNPHHVS